MSKKTWFSILFWVISLTWGVILTAIGLLVTGVAILLGGKPHKNGCTYIVEIGNNWGGLSIGSVALCGGYNNSRKQYYYPAYYEKVRRHEFGHSLQHLYLGPLYLFVVGLISAGRYWYHTIASKKGKSFPPNWYEEKFWAEKNATKYGTKAIEWLEPGEEKKDV